MQNMHVSRKCTNGTYRNGRQSVDSIKSLSARNLGENFAFRNRLERILKIVSERVVMSLRWFGSMLLWPVGTERRRDEEEIGWARFGSKHLAR